MVSTRHHPRAFPEPELPPSRTSTPTKASPTKSRSKSTTHSTASSPPASPLLDGETSPTAVAKTLQKRVAQKASSTSSALSLTGYTHNPHIAILAWLAISLPLVAWDTLYVLLRPHTMPGGRLHSPFWTPYALYGTVDYTYGWPAWNNHVGFTAAQASLNLLESIMYGWYAYVVGAQVTEWSYEGLRDLQVKGRDVDLAVLICFSAAVTTFSKTVLYWLNEFFSGFENIGHNSLFNLIVLWVIPNGAWIALPGFIIYVLGKEILGSMAAGGDGKKIR